MRSRISCPSSDVFRDVKFIPISALNGDNVVDASKHTPWYEGPTLLAHLENVHIASDWNLNTFRFPVQWVNRPNNPTDPKLHDFRGLSGQIASGIVRKGQPVVVLPAGIKTTVKEIWTYDGSRRGSLLPAIRDALPGARHRHQPRRHDRGPGTICRAWNPICARGFAG